MHLARTCITQQTDDPRTGGSADDRIVDQHHPLVPDGFSNHVQLDPHRILPLALGGLDEGTADIAVFDEPDPIRNTALLGIAKRSIQTRIRHADHHIRLHRIFPIEDTSGTLPRLMDADSLYHRVGAREIDILKDTETRFAAAMGVQAMQAVLIGDHDLARLNVPHKLRADAVERAGFGRKHHAAARCLADAERAEPVGVAHRNQLFRGHNDQRIGTLNRVHRLCNRVLNAGGEQPLTGDDIADDLRIIGGVEDRAVQLQLTAQLGRVDQIAVMSQRHCTLAVTHHQRLGVDRTAVAGS